MLECVDLGERDRERLADQPVGAGLAGAQQQVGDVLQHVERCIGELASDGSRVPEAASSRAPGIRSGSQQQHDAVHRGQVPGVRSTDCWDQRSSPAGSNRTSSTEVGREPRRAASRERPGPPTVNRKTSGIPVARARRRGLLQHPAAAVQRRVMDAGELLRRMVVGRTHRRVQVRAEPVHQLVHEHGQQHRLAGFLRAYQGDQVAGDIFELGGQPPVACPGRSGPSSPSRSAGRPLAGPGVVRRRLVAASLAGRCAGPGPDLVRASSPVGAAPGSGTGSSGR